VTGHQHEWLPQTADELRCACGERVSCLELATLLTYED